MKTHKYLYSVSNIRILENRMLKADDYLNLASAKDYKKTIDILIQLGYLKEDDRKIPIEKMLEEKKADLLRKLKELNLPLPDIFFLENDFYNIKVYAKCAEAKLSPEDYLTPLSGNSDRRQTALYGTIAQEALYILQTSHSGKEAEEYIDSCLYKTGLEQAQDNFFKGWFNLLSSIKTSDTEDENKKIEYLKAHKNDSFSIAPIFGYFYGSLTELRNIRTIIAGKRINAPKEEIMERLCISYA